MFSTRFYDLVPSPAGGFPKKRIGTYGVELGPIISEVSRPVGEEKDYGLGALFPKLKVMMGGKLATHNRVTPGLRKRIIARLR